MRLLLRFAALLCLSPLVFGDVTKTFTVAAPAQRENGDPIQLSELDSYRIQCGLLPGGPYDIHQFEQSSTGLEEEAIESGDIFVEGTYYCVATVTDIDDRRSGNSNEINFTVGRCEVSDCRPRPPSLSVTP